MAKQKKEHFSITSMLVSANKKNFSKNLICLSLSITENFILIILGFQNHIISFLCNDISGPWGDT